MLKLRVAFLPLLAFFVSACAGQNGLGWGAPDDSSNNGSYSGSTLNSPVADQNPHPGGDPSYPSSVSDQGKPLATPDKLDGR